VHGLIIIIISGHLKISPTLNCTWQSSKSGQVAAKGLLKGVKKFNVVEIKMLSDIDRIYIDVRWHAYMSDFMNLFYYIEKSYCNGAFQCA
jgi:hypothetical protein